MIGLSRMSRIPEYVPPAAWASGSTDAVYSSGTATSHQAGRRSQGTSTTSAAVAARISALAIASGSEAGPGGSARLASARQARMANGAILASSPSRRRGGPEVSVSGSAASRASASRSAGSCASASRSAGRGCRERWRRRCPTAGQRRCRSAARRRRPPVGPRGARQWACERGRRRRSRKRPSSGSAGPKVPVSSSAERGGDAGTSLFFHRSSAYRRRVTLLTSLPHREVICPGQGLRAGLSNRAIM